MPFLKAGDLVRFVSPASRPDPAGVARGVEALESWGLRVEVAPHAFDKQGYLAGTDGDRLEDLAQSLLDPAVRAVFATRGGKGSYRIADRLPVEAMRRDPKPIVGFSDITILLLSAWRTSGAAGVHGAFSSHADGTWSTVSDRSLRHALMSDDPVEVEADPDVASAALTTTGSAMGPLLGGNLDMLATAAGWALPSLRGAVLLVESAGLAIGHFDRCLTMLVRGGHFDGVVGVAIGRIDGTPANGPIDALWLCAIISPA